MIYVFIYVTFSFAILHTKYNQRNSVEKDETEIYFLKIVYRAPGSLVGIMQDGLHNGE